MFPFGTHECSLIPSKSTDLNNLSPLVYLTILSILLLACSFFLLHPHINLQKKEQANIIHPPLCKKIKKVHFFVLSLTYWHVLAVDWDCGDYDNDGMSGFDAYDDNDF